MVMANSALNYLWQEEIFALSIEKFQFSIYF